MTKTEVTEQEKVDRKLADGWKRVKLGDICHIKGGKRLPIGGDFAIEITAYPYIRVVDFQNGTINLEGLKYIEKDIHLQISRYIINRDDVYLSIAGSVGIAGVIPKVLDGANLTENAARLIIKNQSILYRDFLAKFLQSPFGQEAIRCRTNLVGQPKLALERIATIEIRIPPLSEQKRIAAILNEQMEAVERSRKATEAQLEAAKALPAAYLRAVFNSPEAQKWGRKTIGEIAETCSGTTPSRERLDYYVGLIPWVKTGELLDGFIEDTEEHISESALRETSLKLLPPGTLLIAMYGQGKTRGRTGLLLKPATTNQACFAILPNPEKFDSLYLQWWFRHSYSRLRRETEGRGGNQPNLNGDVLRTQKVPLPPLDEQKRISSFLKEKIKKLGRLNKSLQDQLDAINKLPAAILRKAFNGKL